MKFACDELAVLPHDESDMASSVARTIAHWVDTGTAPSDVAVLTRVNSSLLPVQAALAEQGIPMIGTLGPSLLERTVIRAALAWIRIALDLGFPRAYALRRTVTPFGALRRGTIELHQHGIVDISTKGTFNRF